MQGSAIPFTWWTYPSCLLMAWSPYVPCHQKAWYWTTITLCHDIVSHVIFTIQFELYGTFYLSWKIWCLSSPTFGMKNVPLKKNLRTVFQLCCCQLVHGPFPRSALKDFWNNRRRESVPFVSKVHPSSPSRLSVHGLPPRPTLTDFWNNRRQESVPFVSKIIPRGPSRLSVHSLPPRPALTDFWDNRREESVLFVSKVHPSGPSRTSVHGLPPLPALTDFWNNRREESVPFVSKVHPNGPSRTSVHDLPPRPALTDFWNNRREESVPFVSKVHPAARQGQPSMARPHGPLWQTSETIGMRNPCGLFQKSILAARHGRPSRPALTNFWDKRRPIRTRRLGLVSPPSLHADYYTRTRTPARTTATAMLAPSLVCEVL